MGTRRLDYNLRVVDTPLHEIIPRFTRMPVELITDRLTLSPNRVFVIPENRDLLVLRCRKVRSLAGVSTLCWRPRRSRTKYD